MIEITVRRFYRCDEGIVVPSITYEIDETADDVPNFDIKKVAKKLAGEVNDLPGTDWRLMTESEVEAYLAGEDEEISVPVGR